MTRKRIYSMHFENYRPSLKTRTNKDESTTYACYQDGKKLQQIENTITFLMTSRTLREK